MTPLVEKIKKYEKFRKELADTEDLINSEEGEIKEIAVTEKMTLEKNIENLDNEIKILLLPKDDSDQKNAIVEIRAGTGGEEAALLPLTCLGCM